MKIINIIKISIILTLIFHWDTLKASDEIDKVLKDFTISDGRYPDKRVAGNKTVMDLKLDKQTAIKLAEIILVKIYGEAVLKQRPWVVTEDNFSFKIKGTFNYSVDHFGGVSEIVISKSDARVLKYSHDL